ncbi:2-oxo acid dehydrogenase subunit E2 [Pseudomonas aeruginosa]|nr:2-oxo acid dehydrogenase subunit E2 [Pseudomonas aeruginosa]
MSELIRVPDIGNGEGEVIELLVKPGDKVEADQSLLTLESDKASMEIPSPKAGVVKSIKAKVGDTLKEGDEILELEVEGGEQPAEAKAEAAPAQPEAPKAEAPAPAPSESKPAAPAAASVQDIKVPDIGSAGKANIIEVMVKAGDTVEADQSDITDMEAFRVAQKAAAEKAGVKLTVLPILLKACAHLLKELPDFNSSLAPSGKALIRKKYVHIGFAVDTPDGLLVPVIRDVDRKSLLQLAAEAADLADKARNKKLSADAMQGACFTISSLGHIGGTGFTPIVNAPEVAILGVSKATMQPVWDGKAFQPRLMLPLSLSYDHRVINGAAAARFTKRLGELLADIRTLLL